MFETLLAIISGIALIGFQINFSIKNSGKMPFVFPGVFFGLALLWFIILMSLSQGSLKDSILIFAVINIPTLVFLIVHAITRLVIRFVKK